MDFDKFFEPISPPEPCSYILPDDPNDILASRMCDNDATSKTRHVFVKTMEVPDYDDDGKITSHYDQDIFLPQDSSYSLGGRAIRICDDHKQPFLEQWYDEAIEQVLL